MQILRGYRQSATPPAPRPIEVFFNRPQRPIPLDRLFNDMNVARRRLFVVSAWATLREIGDVFLSSIAAERVAVFSKADLVREGGTGRALHDRIERAVNEANARDRRSDDDNDSDILPFVVTAIGSTDFREGIMHHKFVVADDVVWTGSYNLTFQAAKNYETLMRIDSAAIADQFASEARALVASETALWTGTEQMAWAADGTFRCGICQRLKPVEQLGSNSGSWMACKACDRNRTRTT